MKRDNLWYYLWRRAMVSCDEAENAFVYAMMELAAISIAGIVWAFWNMVSPEKEETDWSRLVQV